MTTMEIPFIRSVILKITYDTKRAAKESVINTLLLVEWIMDVQEVIPDDIE